MAAVPVSPPDFFATLGVPRRFGQDLPGLERRYYALSRELHPDRFATAPAGERRDKLARMSLVNDAYRTLKDRARLREHLLELEGGVAAKVAPPAGWAERWFDVQDEAAAIPAFAADLTDALAERESALASLEELYDREPAAKRLGAIAAAVQELAYLRSMARDVERISS